METEKHDVVVVGAGPGGSVTAKTAAERGLDVLLIERNQEIGFPVKCAEGISKEIENMVKIDKKWICAQIKGANIYYGNDTKIVLSAGNNKIGGYVLERRIFDRFLAREAAHAGAEVRVKTQAYGVIREKNRGYANAKGVYTRCMGEDVKILGDVVVGADGVESKVGRWAGIDTQLRPADMAICAEFLMSDIEVNQDYCQFFLGNDIAPKGYCLIGDSEVITRNSLKPISEIKEGEEVYSLLGWAPVTATSVRDYKGNVVKITPFMFNTEVKLTEDHLVYVWNKKEGFVWKRARELEKGVRGKHRNGDYLIFPIPFEEKVSHIDLSNYFDGIIEEEVIYPVGKNQYDAVFKYKHGLKKNFPLSKELMELFGYFISEGNVNSNGIIISNTNLEIIERVKAIGKKIFGFKSSIWEDTREGRKKCVQVHFASKILQSFFAKEFGVGCRNKRIPKWLFGLPTEIKKSFLIGLFRGDGSKWVSSNGYDVLSYTSTSKQLIYDLWMLLTTLEIVGAIGRNKKKDAYTLKIFEKQIDKLVDIFGKCRHGEGRNRGFFIKDNFVFLGIRKLKKEYFSSNVYDIESGGSFCPGFIVHNCWIFPKGEDCANVGVGIGGDVSDEKHRAIAYLNAFVKSRFPDTERKIISEIYGAVPLSGPIYETVADGLILVGDAARQTDPLTGGGILEAMKAGEIAGDVIAKAVQEKNVSRKRLAEYERRWESIRGKKLKKELKAKKFLLSLSSDNLDALIHSIGELKIKMDEPNVRELLKELVKKNPQMLFRLAKLLF
jgi:flavin-dependent dehydrogenase/intein/homing endonuclease